MGNAPVPSSVIRGSNQVPSLERWEWGFLCAPWNLQTGRSIGSDPLSSVPDFVPWTWNAMESISTRIQACVSYFHESSSSMEKVTIPECKHYTVSSNYEI